jgi:hypothetical protein
MRRVLKWMRVGAAIVLLTVGVFGFREGLRQDHIVAFFIGLGLLVLGFLLLLPEMRKHTAAEKRRRELGLPPPAGTTRGFGQYAHYRRQKREHERAEQGEADR